VEADAKTMGELSEDTGSLEPAEDDADSGMPDAAPIEPDIGEAGDAVQPTETDESHVDEEPAHPADSDETLDTPDISPEPAGPEAPEAVEAEPEPEIPLTEAEITEPSGEDPATTDTPLPPESMDGAPEVKKEDAATAAGDDSSALDDIMDILGIDEEE
jgi:hypothetical protein